MCINSRRREFVKFCFNRLLIKTRLSEKPNYSMSDRYSDIIKSMWFVFMYAPLIPLVTILFMIGLILFYWIDKVLSFLKLN